MDLTFLRLFLMNHDRFPSFLILRQSGGDGKAVEKREIRNLEFSDLLTIKPASPGGGLG